MAEKKTSFTRQKLDEIIAKHPTPFYIYDEQAIIENARRLNKAFSWAPGFKNYFAVKANPNHFILKLLKAQGMGADCSSLGEVELAARVGMTGNEMMFTSNSTTLQAFKYAGVRGAVLNLDDIMHIPTLISAIGVPETVCFRLNPGDAVKGGNIIGQGTEVKFGCPERDILDAYKQMRDAQGPNGRRAKNFGLHMMAGSNRLDEQYFTGIAGLMFDTIANITDKLGIRFTFVNLGGGIGIPYRPEENALDIEKMSENIREQYEKKIAAKGLPHLDIFMENGRMVTGPYGQFVAKVEHIEQKYKLFAKVAATEAQFPRPGTYGPENAYHHITVPGKEHLPHDHTYDVAGSLCENWKFAVDRKLPALTRGDILVFHDAGAHCFAMTSNYNGSLKPAELLLRTDGTAIEIRRAQTTHDLTRQIPLEELNHYEP